MTTDRDAHQRFLAAQAGEPIPAPDDRRRPSYEAATDPAEGLPADQSTWTRAQKVAYVKRRANAEPWDAALASVIQDMSQLGIPLDPIVAQLGMAEAVMGGERGVRRFIDGLT